MPALLTVNRRVVSSSLTCGANYINELDRFSRAVFLIPTGNSTHLEQKRKYASLTTIFPFMPPGFKTKVGELTENVSSLP